MRSYRLSKSAQSDIDAIWDRFAEHGGVNSAEKFLWRLYDLFAILSQNSLMGQMSRLVTTGVRKFSLDNYLIYYVAQDKRVLIGRILHGKRRQRKAFRESDK